MYNHCMSIKIKTQQKKRQGTLSLYGAVKDFQGTQNTLSHWIYSGHCSTWWHYGCMKGYYVFYDLLIVYIYILIFI